MTATDDRLPATVPVHVTPARLVLTPVGQAAGRLDGAWWPRSRDLTQELPSLVRAMAAIGVVTRATVNPTLWQNIPRRFPVSGRVVKVGWFTEAQDLHEIMLLSYRTARWDLLVVPPETDPDDARQMMADAATARDMRSATMLVDAVSARNRAGRGDADRSWEDDWESEGGHLRTTEHGPALAAPTADRPFRGLTLPEPGTATV